MADDQAVTQLVFDARTARQGADEFVASAQRIIGVNDQVIASEAKKMAAAQKAANELDVMARVSDRVVTSLSSQQRFLDRLAKQYDPFNTAVRQAQGELGRLNGIIAQGGERAAQASTLLAGAQQKLASAQKVANENTAQSVAVTGQMRFAVQNLGFQINDIATSLASGGSPFRVLAQQGGQVVQAFQQSGAGVGGTLAAVGRSIASMITPTTAAVAGVVALAAGVGVLVSRAADANQSVRVFNVLLRGMGDTALADAAGLEAAAKRLRDVGLSAADARAQILSVGRAGLNPAAAEQIIRTGANLTAYLGGDQTTRLVQAFSGGVSSAVQFGLSVKALTVTQAENALEMARHGQSVQALDILFQTISRHAQGLERDSLSPTAKAARDLGVAWNNLLDRLSNSRPILVLVESLTKLVDALDKLAQFKPPSWLTSLMGAVVPGVGAGGGFLIGKALEGAQSLAANMNQPVATAAIPSGGPGTPAAAAAQAASMVGLTESRDASTIRQFLASAGNNLDPQTVAWCAAFANAVLARQGIAGTGSNVATSFLNWGSAVSGDVAAGDVIVLPRGHSAGQTGGHVGIATGATSLTDRGLLLEMISGNQGNAISRTMVDANEAVLRRATTAGNVPSIPGAGFNDAARVAADEYAKAQQRLADATRGVGLEQDKLRIATEVLQNKEFESLTTEQKQALTRDLITSATTRLNNEIANAAAITANEITGQRNVADAYLQGSKAGLVMENALKAATEAFSKFGTVSSDAAKQFAADRFKEISALETQSERVRNNRDLLTQRESQQQLQLQIGLQGQTTEEIQRQVTLLQAKQQIEREFPFLTQQEKDNRLATVAATADLNVKLADATREQQRLDDGIRSVASTVENTLTKSIEDAFSGAKVESWGKRIKSMLGSLVAQISDALFIKPLLGSIIGGLGFGSAAQGFGSFGNLFGSSSGGLLGSLFGSSTPAPVATLTPNGSGGFNIQTLGQAAGVVKDVAGGGIFGSGSSSGGLFGNVGNWINNNIGTSLGFAPAGLVNGTGMGAGIFTDIGTGITSDVAGGGVASGLFGGTTLTGLLGGVGAGFGAGSLLNSLLGGNKLLGSIGSGVGSIAGAVIGSVIPGIGTLLGGLLGGAGGGLFGLFGNNKPRNQSAGGNIDFATGRVSGTFSGGNQQIDQATQGALQQISQFTQAILRASGGSLSGGVLLQNGVNTGFGVDSTLPGFTGNFRLGKDAANAVTTVELALAHSLTGISDTMKQVINTVTDPAQLQDAITFAGVYDKLKEAFDGAFSSISQDTKVVGPFGQALDQLNTTFADLTQKAGLYGLSLDPITAGLAEATKRLKSDFQTALEQMASGDNGQFLGAAQAAHQQFIQNQNDAAALGFTDAATAAKIAAIETEQLGAALGALDLAALQKAVTTFADTAPEVSQFAQALIDSAQFLPDQITQLTLAITDPVTLAIDKEKLAGAERVRIAQATGQDIIAINKYNQLALDQIWNQATASLVSLQTDLLSGASSGLTAAQQVTAANDNFTKELALVQAGNLAEITNFATAASNLIQLSTQTYGNAPQTADIRTSILTAIDQVLSQNGFASGTLATPPGTILVGERGPELISQPGGLRVWSNPETERLLAMMPSRHFADGTDFLPALPSFTTSRPANDASNGEVAQLLRDVLSELRGGNRIAQGVGSAVVGKLGDVHGAIEEGNQPGFVEPPRRRVA